MIIDDPEYHAVLDDLNIKVMDDHIYIDVSSMILINESIITHVIMHRDMLTEDQYWSMATILETYKAMFDTISDKFAAKIVPDDVSEITDGE